MKIFCIFDFVLMLIFFIKGEENKFVKVFKIDVILMYVKYYLNKVNVWIVIIEINIKER